MLLQFIEVLTLQYLFFNPSIIIDCILI